MSKIDKAELPNGKKNSIFSRVGRVVAGRRCGEEGWGYVCVGVCRVAREMVREAAKVWKGLRPKTWAVADSTRSCAGDRGSSGGVEAMRTLTTATVAELRRQSNHVCRWNERALFPSSYTLLVFLSLAVLYFKHKHSSILFSFCFFMLLCLPIHLYFILFVWDSLGLAF